MAGITALNNIIRQRAAFGGIMGRDGRRQYGGGSDMGTVSTYDSSTKKGRKAGPGTGGYQGGALGGMGDADRDGPTDRNPYDKGKEEFKKIAKQQKENYLTGVGQSQLQNIYDTGVPESNIPFFGNFLNAIRPLRNKGLRKNIDYFKALKNRNPNLDYEDTLEGYKQYMSDRLSGAIDASGNTIYNSGEASDIPTSLFTQNNIGDNIGDNEDVAEETTFDYRFGDPNENQADDVTQGYYAANGGRVPRAFGGIMDTTTGRKAYGLGSLFKSVKKAAGKILKSDIGKAAIAGAMFYYGGGGTFKPGGSSTFKMGNFFSNKNPLLFSSKDIKGVATQVFDPMKFAGLTTLGGFLAGPAKVDTLPDSGTRGGKLIDPLTGKEATPAEMRENIELAKLEAGDDPVKLDALNAAYNNMLFSNVPYENYGTYAANGGRIGRAEGGLMDLGGMEKDYRAEGGFVPIGKAEKADDVPARLSVNEFVFTADAVRNAGGGDIDKGAEVMENMMKNLENGGRVSEESQGNTGAQEMFSVSERIGEVI